MSSGSLAANADKTHPRPGARGSPPGKRGILARTANKEVGDVLWVPGGDR
ncbi:hypothetical protein [Streptomyces ipomoeae]|jgi:hypothetical protein|nr:hypothetical protein [Streptomyces ipomoeae]